MESRCARARRDCPESRACRSRDPRKEKDVPRALPIEPEAPRGRRVTADELEAIQRIRRARETERIRAEEEALRLKRDREIKLRREGRKDDITEVGKEPVIPRALPINNTGRPKPELEPEPKPEPGPQPLSPLEVAAGESPRAPRAPRKGRLQDQSLMGNAHRCAFAHHAHPRPARPDRRSHWAARSPRVGYLLAIKLPHLEGTPKSKVLSFARSRIKLANRVLSQGWERSDAQVLAFREPPLVAVDVLLACSPQGRKRRSLRISTKVWYFSPPTCATTQSRRSPPTLSATLARPASYPPGPLPMLVIRCS